MDDEIRVGMLGPLQVWRRDRPVRVASAMQRMLVARLALDPGRTIAVDALIDDLWEDRPPADARGALHHHVSRLRKAIGPVVVTRGAGYLLEVEPDHVDALCFARLARAGRAALRAGDVREAGTALRAALALRRGPPLPEFLDREWARPVVVRLQEQHVDAVEDRIEVDLAAGLHADLVEEIREVLAANPFRERLWGQLMLALYRCGRQPDALAAYAEARHVLADEHGLDPGPELARLEQAILTHDPEVAAPRAASPGGRSGNLPAPLTGLVGRAEDIRAVGALLGRSRLVTLTGPPGVGKTRLAVEVARALEPEVPDGAWFVELGPLTDGAAVAAVVAAPFPVRGSGAPRSDDAADLARYLRRRAPLLVDNCEHLLAEVAGLLGPLLAACPHLRVLATSREVLGVAGEAVWPVAALGVPAPDERDPGRLAAADAVRLFEDRARSIRPSFVLTAETLPSAADLCRRLDGLPLAIELAAARVSVLPVDHLAAALGDRFRLLVTRSRTAPARQQTLRAAVEWSYDLLSAPERALYEQLSMFAAGCSLPAAESVGSRLGLQPLDTLALLADLADKSLLVAATAADGGPRYRMLETLREYGGERLHAHGGRDQAARRHAELFADLAEDGETGLYGPEGPQWVRRLDEERENLRQAVWWAAASGRADLALRTAGALGFYFGVTERHAEGRAWLDEALAGPADGVPPATVARAVSYRGFLAAQLGDLERGVADAERGLALVTPSGDGWQTAQSTAILALVLGDTGPTDRVATLLARARALYRDVAEPRADWGLAACGLAAARHAMRIGDVALVEREVWQVVRPSQRLRYELFEAWGRMLLAWVASRRGEIAVAMAESQAAHQLARGPALPHYLAFVLAVRGRLALQAGDREAARTLHDEAAELVDDAVSPWFAAFVHQCLATTLERCGRAAAAEALYRRALAESPPPGSAFAQEPFYLLIGGSPAARSLIGLGELAVREGTVMEARDLVLDGVERAQRDADQPAVALGLEVLAAVAAAAGAAGFAATLLGAASAHRSSATLWADGHEAAGVEATAAALRSALGDAEFRQAYDRGRGLPPAAVLDAPPAAWSGLLAPEL